MIRVFRAAAGAMAAGLLAVTAAGCGTAPTGPAARNTTSLAKRAAPLTAWQRTLDQVGPDGTVSTATALDAFALAIGPVPGVRPQPGAAQAIPSGTIAVQWVLGHWGQLTSGQQHAVLSDLGVTTTTSRDSAPAADPAIPCLTADVGNTAPFRGQAAAIESDIATQIGDGPFSPDVYFSVNTQQLAGAKTKMYTYGCTGAQPTQAGPVTGCTIHINPLATSGAYSPADLHDFLIHELTHCYLFLKLGAAYYGMPPWYVEGVPMWTMTALGNGSSVESTYWLSYLNTPATSLFSRSYDALGFFVHLAETGTDVWHKILPIGQAVITGGSAAGWQAAGPSPAFLDSWGSGYAQGRYPGQAWQTDGPNLPHYAGPIPDASVHDGQTVQLTAKTAGTAIEQVDLDAQVVVVSSSGYGRLSLDKGSDATLAEAAGTTYATGNTPAACPAGSAGAGTSLTPISSGLHYVSVSGGLASGQVSVQGMSLASFCAKQTAASCIVGTWTSTQFQAATTAATEHGGAGVTMRIGNDGSTSIDFSPMSPVVLSGQELQGDLIFGGTVTGKLVLPTSPAAGSASTWAYAAGGPPDYSSLTATVHTTSPVDYTFGPISISALASSFGADSSAVDAHPLSGGTWTCSGNTLVIRAPSSVPSHGTWTWTRTS